MGISNKSLLFWTRVKRKEGKKTDRLFYHPPTFFMFFYTQNIVGFSLFVSFSIVCVIVNSVCAVLLAIQQNKVWIHLYSTHFSRIIFLCFACVFFAFYFFFWLETQSFEWYFFIALSHGIDTLKNDDVNSIINERLKLL